MRHRAFNQVHTLAFVFACTVVLATGALAQPKILRNVVQSVPNSFDPHFESEQQALEITDVIFEPMLTYEYLTRPAKLKPLTLASLPEVRDNGRVYICRVKPGVLFADDPAFNSKPRELTAADYAYSLKRLLDPATSSQWLFLVEGKLEGGDGAQQRAKTSGKFDYDAPFAGLMLLDRYTLKITLKQPDYNFAYLLATPATAALAREVVERYGQDIGAHPVGTGPFMLGEWQRGSKVVLKRNPSYRGTVYDEPATGDAEMDAIRAGLLGKRLPLIDGIETLIQEEPQPRYLAFLGGELDYIRPVPQEFARSALPGGKVAPNLAKRGIVATPDEQAFLRFAYFGMKDPVLGGFEPEKIALRRAIALAYDRHEDITIRFNNQALPATMPVSPGVAGYDSALRLAGSEHDPAKAKALLDLFGYRDVDGDGFREAPDGSPLAIDFWSTPDARSYDLDRLFAKSLAAVGLRINIKKDKLPELRKRGRAGTLSFLYDGWIADYPDAENFFQLLYGPNAGQGNRSHFKLPAFDALYRKAAQLPDSPERNALYREMSKLVVAYAPWILTVYPRETALLHPWVKHYRKHPFLQEPWLFVDIDVAARDQALGRK